MEIVRYHPLNHASLMKTWREAYGLDLKAIDELPEFGLVAFDGELPICAGFLRKVEASKQVFLDSLIANPKTSGKIRYHAIDSLCEALIKEAEERKFESIWAISVDAGTLKRSLKHGFRATPSVVVTRGVS